MLLELFQLLISSAEIGIPEHLGYCNVNNLLKESK